jgi:hypothetical protein
MMTKRKFIGLSILKTWFFSTALSIICFIVYRELTKIPGDVMRNCDMSALAYGVIIFWVLGLSSTSFTSLISLSKNSGSKVKIGLCRFLLPVIFSVYFLVSIAEGTIDRESFIFFMLVNVPWFLIWGFYYNRFKKVYADPENIN